MKCPVCQIDLELPENNLEELYYDCTQCGSSLLLQNGKCEVLAEGKAPSSEDIEEEFIPDETTEVPELTQPEEDDSPSEENQTSIKEFQKETPEEYSSEESEQTLSKVSAQNTIEESKPFHKNETIETEHESLNPLSEKSHTNSTPAENIGKGDLKDEVEKTSSTLSTENLQSQQEDSQRENPVLEKDLEKLSSESQIKKSDSSSDKKEDFADVAEFGNTQDPDREGAFLYDLTLSEINSQKLREKVLSVLEDDSLNIPLHTEEQSLTHLIKDGQLIISKISPVKTYIIVTALMGLPLKISWSQHHITQVSMEN